MSPHERLHALVDQLSDDLADEVLDFAEYLQQKREDESELRPEFLEKLDASILEARQGQSLSAAEVKKQLGWA